MPIRFKRLGPRPTLVWIVSLYSVIASVLIYADAVDLVTGTLVGVALPVHQRVYVYLSPGLLLCAGVALFFFRKVSFQLYVTYLLAVLLHPIVLPGLYTNPFFATNWLEVYKDMAQSRYCGEWLLGVLMAGYSGYLYHRGILK